MPVCIMPHILKKTIRTLYFTRSFLRPYSDQTTFSDSGNVLRIQNRNDLFSFNDCDYQIGSKKFTSGKFNSQFKLTASLQKSYKNKRLLIRGESAATALTLKSLTPRESFTLSQDIKHETESLHIRYNSSGTMNEHVLDQLSHEFMFNHRYRPSGRCAWLSYSYDQNIAYRFAHDQLYTGDALFSIVDSLLLPYSLYEPEDKSECEISAFQPIPPWAIIGYRFLSPGYFASDSPPILSKKITVNELYFDIKQFSDFRTTYINYLKEYQSQMVKIQKSLELLKNGNTTQAELNHNIEATLDLILNFYKTVNATAEQQGLEIYYDIDKVEEILRYKWLFDASKLLCNPDTPRLSPAV